MTPQDILKLIELELSYRADDNEFTNHLYSLVHAYSPTCTHHEDMKKKVEERINYYKSINEW